MNDTTNIIDVTTLFILFMSGSNEAKDLAYEINLVTGYMKQPIYRLN